MDHKERDRKLKIRLDAIKGCGANKCRICDDHCDFALSLLKDEPVKCGECSTHLAQAMSMQKRITLLENLLREVLNSDMAQREEDEGNVSVLLGTIRVQVT